MKQKQSQIKPGKYKVVRQADPTVEKLNDCELAIGASIFISESMAKSPSIAAAIYAGILVPEIGTAETFESQPMEIVRSGHAE